MKDRYVLLTGAKNNAGDFLIGRRAKDLLAWLRPDRSLLSLDRWKPLTPEELETINDSRALILTGGPALQPNMYPGIYPLVDDLKRLQAPIVAMAIGWKSRDGSWAATHRYTLTDSTKKLLAHMDSSGHLSSVRDYHTLNVLAAHGFRRFAMTGCAALYSRPHLAAPFAAPAKMRKVSFSLGVGFLRNPGLAETSKKLILRLRAALPEASLEVVFHHATDEKAFRASHGSNLELFVAQRRVIEWLAAEGIAHVDVSGGADKMLEHYGACDLHVGFRVHAHILMTSMSRPSVLIAEDGRGMALKDVIGGLVFDACETPAPNKLLRRLGVGASTPKLEHLAEDVVRHVLYEAEWGFPRLRAQRSAIDGHWPVMKTFLERLP